MSPRLALVGALALICGAAAPASAVRPDLAKPIAGPTARSSRPTTGGTPTSAACPCTPASAAWLSHMSTDVDLHPDFGPSYGDGPNYGIPITVVGRTPPRR